MRSERYRPRRVAGAVLGLSVSAAMALGAIAPPAQAAPDAAPYTILFNNFEQGRIAPWTSSHEEIDVRGQRVAESIGLSHETSLQVTGRTQAAHGAAMPTADYVDGGNTYEVSIWSRLLPDEQPTDIVVSLENGGNTIELAKEEATANGWVEIKGTFDAPAEADTGRFIVSATSPTASYWLDDFLLTGFDAEAGSNIDDSVPLKSTLPFPIGAAGDARITEGAGEPTLSKHFNSVSAENHMKPEAWYDTNGNFVAVNPHADSLVNWANANDGRVFGHVMLWHSQIPAWFFESEDGVPLTDSEQDQEIFKDRIAEHIDNVAKYFADKYGPYGSAGNPIKAYEIVNEVVNDGNNPQLRNSRFYQILGEDFIEIAFRLSDAAFNDKYAAVGVDQPVTLFINEYGTEGGDGSGTKLQRYYDLVERMLDKGVPIHGVGHQFHTSLSRDVNNLKIALDKFADLDVVQAVTEFDVSIGDVNELNLIRQGHFVREAFDIFKEFHAQTDAIYSVTAWGLRDLGSWRYYEGAPLLFDNYFNAKWAYRGAAGLSVPTEPKSLNVFGGTVDLDSNATTDAAWNQLPPAVISEGASFGIRWAEDHLTVLVDIADEEEDATDSVSFEFAGGTHLVERDGAADIPAQVAETAAGWRVAAHVPAQGLTQGDVVKFNVLVTAGDEVSGWNDPGVSGELSLLEDLSTTEAVFAEESPLIDGEIDEVWEQAEPITTGKQVEGDDSAAAQVRTLWSDDGETLFVLAEVTDAEIDTSASADHEKDSVEIFIDAGNNKNGSYLPTDMQLRINALNELSFGSGPASQSERVESAVELTDNGYVVEAAIDLLELGGPDTFHGFDAQVNDAENGRRIGVKNWADATGDSWQNTARWGVIHLAPVEASHDRNMSLDKDQVEPGEEVNAELTDFAPQEEVELVLVADAVEPAAGELTPLAANEVTLLASVTVDEQGAATATFVIPGETEPGDYVIEARVDGATVAASSLVITAAAADPGDEDPGGDISPGDETDDQDGPGDTPDSGADSNAGGSDADQAKNLPRTGANIAVLLGASLLLFLVGGGALALRRRGNHL